MGAVTLSTLGLFSSEAEVTLNLIAAGHLVSGWLGVVVGGGPVLTFAALLQTLGLLGKATAGGVVPTTQLFGGGSVSSVAIGDLALTRTGRLLYDLCRLERIPLTEQVDSLSGAWTLRANSG